MTARSGVEDIEDCTCGFDKASGDESVDDDSELLPSLLASGGVGSGVIRGEEWWVSSVSGDLGSDLLGLMLTGGERLME